MALVWEQFSDVEFVKNELRHLIAEQYYREDRRRLVGAPAVSSEDVVAGMLSWHQIAPDEVQFTVEKLLASRGDRLALSRNRITIGHDSYTEMLSLVQLDEHAELLEAVVYFDTDDEERALAELDARAASFGH